MIGSFGVQWSGLWYDCLCMRVMGILLSALGMVVAFLEAYSLRISAYVIGLMSLAVFPDFFRIGWLPHAMYRVPLCICATGFAPEFGRGACIWVPIVCPGAPGNWPTSWSLLPAAVVKSVVADVTWAILCLE